MLDIAAFERKAERQTPHTVPGPNYFEEVLGRCWSLHDEMVNRKRAQAGPALSGEATSAIVDGERRQLRKLPYFREVTVG
jgi:hypothetical protein